MRSKRVFVLVGIEGMFERSSMSMIRLIIKARVSSTLRVSASGGSISLCELL